MTQHAATDPAPSAYFSARRLTAIFGNGDALVTALAREFNLRTTRGAMQGWLQRDSLPGPIIAHMMLANPAFPFRDLIADRGVMPAAAELLPAADPTPTPAGTAALMALLS